MKLYKVNIILIYIHILSTQSIYMEPEPKEKMAIKNSKILANYDIAYIQTNSYHTINNI